jgi:hypothetical protein
MHQTSNRKKAATKGTMAIMSAAAAVFTAHTAFAGVSTIPNTNTTALRPVGQTVPTISLGGSTAIKNFIINGGSTFLTSGTSIILGSGGVNESQITYTAPSGAGVSFQLASGNFSTPDTTSGTTQIHSALRIEYHESGSVEGAQELVDSQINSNIYADNTIYNPNTTQAMWVNRNKFGGNSPNGPIPTNGSPANVNGFVLDYQPASLPRDPQSQSPTQLGVSDNNFTQSFSYGGNSATGNLFATPGTSGYGKGNSALGTVAVPETFAAGARYVYNDQSVVNMVAGATNPSYVAGSPRSGDGGTYAVGPWNTAGVGNLKSTIIAQTATLMAANPGTGLDHLNRTDAQWLQATGRLQNGATFDVTTRDAGSGTRNVYALNTGIDPTFAVGLNDNGNGNAFDGGTAQIAIGPRLTFSNKTSGGSGMRPTLQNARMSVGTISVGDAISVTKNGASRPIRALAYRDDANDLNDNSNGASFTNWFESGGVSATSQGDLPSGQFVQASAATITDGSYVIYQNEQFVAAKVPTAALYNTTAIKGDNGTAVVLDGSSDATAAANAGGSTGHNVENFINNITSATANSPLPTSTSLANPADTLLATSFILPSLMMVQKNQDGLNQSQANASFDSNYRNNIFLPTAQTSNAFNPATADSVTTGSGSNYGNNSVWDTTLNGGPGGSRAANGGAIPITANNWFFGNFNKTDVGAFPGGTHNGVRDLSDLPEALSWAGALYTSGLGSNWDVNAGSNSTVVTGGGSKLGFTPTKGDLIVLGDYNGDGSFDGKDLYYMAVGTSLTDSQAAPNFNTGANTYLTTNSVTAETSPTFGDMVRDGVLHKNAALDYLAGQTTGGTYDISGNATNTAGFLRQSARAVLSGSSVPSGALDLGTTDAANLEQFTFDPTGSHAFDKHDVNGDGVTDVNDAVLVDKYSGKDYTSITDQVGATQQAPVTGQVISVSLVKVQQIDGATTIGAADLTEINKALTGADKANWYGYNLQKTGPGTIDWEHTAGTTNTVYANAGLEVSGGTFKVGGTVDPFTDNSGGATNGTHIALSVDHGATVQFASTNALNTVSSLTVDVPSGATVDLGTKALTIAYGTNPSPNSTIRNYISNAYNVSGARWSGVGGITSSAAVANPAHLSVGFADGADGVVQNLPAGVSSAVPGGGVLPAGAEIVVSAFPGDANLDGKVDFNDFVAISTHFLANDTNWDHGNFNYDGIVDFNDFVVLSTNFGEGVTGGDGVGATPEELAQFNALAASYGISGAQIKSWDATISTLPEPTSAGLLVVGAMGLIKRRSRKTRLTQF